MRSTVYILEDQKGKYYIGSTADLGRRLKAHKAGHTQTTRNMTSPKLVFSQEYELLAEARAIERWLKKLKRKDYIAKIIADGKIRKTPS